MSEIILGAKSDNIKVVVVDELGMFIGVVAEDSAETLVLKEALMFNISQQGMALAAHPLFDEEMLVYKKFVVCISNPKESLLSQYEQYASQKRSGLITAKVMPNLKG